VKSAFDENAAAVFVARHSDTPEELALRVYTARLIGQKENLVLHGGGNTSVKLRRKNIVGEDQEILYVKGSGMDLAAIGPNGFVALDLPGLRKLRVLAHLTDREMDEQLQVHKVEASDLNASVEALLHAFLPHTYVDHTHADSILVLTNLKQGSDIVREALGQRVGVLPYTMSGLPLAKKVAAQYESDPETEAIVILNHGIFTFGHDARQSYERMIHYVNRAEEFIHQKWHEKPRQRLRTRIPPVGEAAASAARFNQMARGICAHKDANGNLRRFYVETRTAPDLVDLSLSSQAQALCHSGVLTPDHVIRTKNRMVHIDSVPKSDEALREVLTRETDAFKKDYDRYFQEQVKAKGLDRDQLDAYPRVFLVGGLGLVTLGLTRRAACVAADLAEQTLRAKRRAEHVGEYVPLSESHVFDMEYWSLQQRKLTEGSFPPLQGQVAVVTGGGGAIGFGIADRLLAAGAAVVISDIDETRLKTVEAVLRRRCPDGEIEILAFDVTAYSSVENAYRDISRRLGGIDIVIPNAGVAHVAKIEDLDPKKLDQVIAVNLKGTFNTIKASIPVFKRQATGGNVVVISSKNVFDPGAAFGAYSASKAGAHQMSKIAALELAALGVRVNMINPDAVFGDAEVSSKLWDLVGPDRMKSRGLDYEGLKEYYRNRNLLKARVLPEHVGNAVVFFASERTPTTGAALPVDGGIPAAFPR
jgi:rhamnose utilization protein RhaD (predicted bifunctional aldolase and dehydrogenase)/NAD(P)-dependent dehydrogenase (short-subunit alcohol dehydrogenase family)